MCSVRRCRTISFLLIFCLLFPLCVKAKKSNEGLDNSLLMNQAEMSVAAVVDISGHWAEEFIDKALRSGLFAGDSDGKFNPDDNVTRAQFIAVLWRMAGKENVEAQLPFEDVEDQIPEFKQAISWGYANGYIKGTSDTTFEPQTPLTREEAMKILHSLSGGKTGGEMIFFQIYEGLFRDSGEISQWAKSSVYWGIYNKLICGTSENALSPKENLTRAQLAKILINYLDIT